MHGLRNWFENRGELKQDGQRISRHYYDLHCKLGSDIGQRAIRDEALGHDCIAHAKTFFNRSAFELDTAQRGTFSLVPSEPMHDRLRADFRNTEAMIFGQAPSFEEILASIQDLETALNLGAAKG